MEEVFANAMEMLEATREIPIQSCEASHPTMAALSRVICFSSSSLQTPETIDHSQKAKLDREQQWTHQALIARARRRVEGAQATVSIPPGTKCINGVDPTSHCESAVEDCERVLKELADWNDEPIAFYGSLHQQLRFDAHYLRVKASSLAIPHLLPGYLQSALATYPTQKFFKKLEGEKPRSDRAAVRECHVDSTDLAAPASTKRVKTTDNVPDSLTCPICQRMFLEPLTTACGHTFCRGCLLECLDHASERGWSCPLCRGPIHLNAATHPVNMAISGLIEAMFPRDLESRRHEERESQLGDDQTTKSRSTASDKALSLPLFVVGAVPPGVRVRMNIFEPRYRLMFRRCLQGSRCFGALAHTGEGPADWGTECRILESRTQADGQILVSCEGIRRFTVLSKSSLDGYLVGSVQPFTDDFEASVQFHKNSAKKADESLRFMEKALRPILLKLQTLAKGGLIKLDGVSPRLLTIPEYSENVDLGVEEAKDRHERMEGVSLLLAGYIDIPDEGIHSDNTMDRVKALAAKKWK